MSTVNPFKPTHAILAWHPTEWEDRKVIYEGNVAACERHIQWLREVPRDRFPIYWIGAFYEIRPIEYVEGVYRALVDELTIEPANAAPLMESA